MAVVGIGPGGPEEMTPRARRAIEEAEVVVGYRTYLDLVRELTENKEVHSSPMRGEVERCRLAVELARAGRRVAVISSGDPGIYGMAGLVLEIVGESGRPPVEIIPGITAASAAAAAAE